MLSTYRFAHIAVFSFEIDFDWKLSLTPHYWQRVILLADHKTSIFTCPRARFTLFAPRNQTWVFFLPCRILPSYIQCLSPPRCINEYKRNYSRPQSPLPTYLEGTGHKVKLAYRRVIWLTRLLVKEFPLFNAAFYCVIDLVIRFFLSLFFLQEPNILAWIFEKFVIAMIIYFLLSIINSMAQAYAKRLDERKRQAHKPGKGE